MRIIELSAVVLALLAPVPATAGPATELVRQFYSNPVANPTDPALRDRFVDPAKAQLDANQTSVDKTGEIGCIDWSLVADGQDWDDAEINRTVKFDETSNGDTAIVVASFTSFDQKIAVEWSLARAGGVWKVSDIASSANGWRLSELDCGPN